MRFLSKHILGALALLLMLFLFSCASYNRQIMKYYENLESGNYSKAGNALDKNRLLGKSRNHLLYLLEKGKVAFLQQQYDSSNRYFNEADLLMEDARTSARDIALGNLLNPMMTTYKGEDFEKYMVHYYKALNYLQLGQPDEALVEARRISLRTYSQEDKYKNDRRYQQDAFSLMLQGLIYEKNGDVNNAFISYRNAVDIYLENGKAYYEVPLPPQLEQDLLRTAHAMGFTDEQERYEKLMGVQLENTTAPAGELVIFWENGLAPVKEEQNLFFALTKNGIGDFVFVDPSGSFQVPFDLSSNYNRDNLKLEDLRSFRVAIPKYREQPVYYTRAVATANGTSYQLEEAENVNALAFATLRQRMLKELSQALTRLAIKKMAELAARPKDENDKDKDKREALALAIQAFSMASEKADTRNWQSLPHSIYYTRIPLQPDANEVTVTVQGPQQGQKTYTFQVSGNGGMQFRTISTLR